MLRSIRFCSLAISAFGLTSFATLEVLAQASDVELTVHGSPKTDEAELHESRPSTSISGEQIKQSSPSSLADGLRRAPSASVQQTTPGQGSIYVRGLSGRAVAHVVDGVRVNASIFRDGNNPYL